MSGGFTPLINKKSFLNNEEKKSTKESRGGWKYKSSKKKLILTKENEILTINYFAIVV